MEKWASLAIRKTNYMRKGKSRLCIFIDARLHYKAQKMKVKLIIPLFVFTLCTSLLFAQDTTYNSITTQLLKIDELDQRYRNQIDFIEKKYGRESKEIRQLYRDMDFADSINLAQVEVILNKYGWPGVNKIGYQANLALFMVIQHAPLSIQVKYLPLMQEAVKNGNANAKDLALLEDRIAIFQGRLQIYGSQLFWNKKTKEYYILPLADPDNVDKRRSEAGLQPLSKYVSSWGIQWNVEKYKKELPSILSEWKKILSQLIIK